MEENFIQYNEYKKSFDIENFILKLIILFVSIMFLVFIIFGIVYYLKWLYPIDRDVWDNLDRAQITAESEDMLLLVNKAIIGLESREQDKGHCALIFKKPSNSLDAQFLALKNIKMRLEITNTFDKNSVEYQSAIDDIRGTIREVSYIHCWIWHFD